MPGEPRDDTSGRVPFWAHQVVELLLGVLLLFQGARTGQHTAVLVGLGAALLVLALTSDGPVAAWPWIGRRVHRVLDFGFVVVLALAPVLLSLDRVLAIVVVELTAVAMGWLALRTSWTQPRRASRTASAVPDAPAVPDVPGGPTLARRLGAVTGDATRDAPRRLGRAVGRARPRAKRPPSPP
jgi:hypothetical protein